MPMLFVVSSQPRSGTHLMCQSLNSHPEIVVPGEAQYTCLRRACSGKEDPKQALDRFQSRNADRRAVGFAVHSWCLGRYPEVAGMLARRRPRVILLHRLQLLERLCSVELRRRTGVYQHRGPGPPKRRSDTFSITPAEAVRHFESFTEQPVKDRQFWLETRCPVLEFTYEYLVEHYAEAMEIAQAFLGVRPRKLTPQTQKLELRRPRETIENYEELREALKDTRWARFFAD